MIKKLAALTALLLFVGYGSANVPDITSTDITPKFADAGEQVTYEISANGDDNLETAGVIIRNPEGEIVRNVNGTPANNQIDADFNQELLSSAQSGEYEVEFFAVDQGLRISEYSTLYYKIDEKAPDFNINGPVDGETIDYSPSNNGASVGFSTDISPQSSGTLELFIDFQDGNGFNQYYSEQVSSGSQTVQTTELISEGAGFQYFWRYTRDSTGNQFNSDVRQFNVNELDSDPNVEDMTFTPSDPGVSETVAVDISFSDDVGLNNFTFEVQNPSGDVVSSTNGPLSGTSDTATISQGFTPSQSGSYTVFATATDTKGQVDGLTETVNVGSIDSNPNVNQVTLSKDDVVEGESVGISANINDDKEIAFYSIDILKDDAVVKQISDGFPQTSSTTVSGTWTPSDSGQYQVQVRTVDSSDQETIKTKAVDVTPKVEPADFILNKPDANSTFAYGPTENFATVDFNYRVGAKWNGTGNLVVTGDGISGEVNIPFSHTKRFSNITSSQDLTEGGLQYKVEITRDGTNRTYTSKEKQFAVVQTEEPVPQATFNKPNKTLSASAIFNPVNIDVSLDSDINSLTTVSLTYPTGFSEIIAQRNTSNQVTSFDLQENLDTVEKTAGDYQLEVRTDSQATGNTYTETYDFTVQESPVFGSIKPEDDRIILDAVDADIKNTEFSANLENVVPGTVEYQIRSPQELDFTTIATEQVSKPKETLDINFDYNVDVVFAGQADNGRSFTGVYNRRVKFTTENGNTFVSDLSGFSYKEPKLSIIDRFENGVEDALGPQGLAILAILLIIFVGGYLGILTGNGMIAIAGMVLANFLFLFLGWFPIPGGIEGVGGTILIVGLALVLASKVGEVIS